MEAKKEGTLHFAERTGDKLFIEIQITGNPDEVVNKIMKSISKETEIFEGAKVNQMLFKGKSIDGIIENSIKEATDKIDKVFDEMKQKLHY